MSEEKFSYFVGLDIGTTAIRCVVGELSGGNPNPAVIGFSEVPSSGMRKGNVAHPDDVAQVIVQAIEEAERMSGQQIHSATINVNGTHVQGINSRGVIAISSPNREVTHDDLLRVEEAATVFQLPPNKDIIQVFAKNYRLDGQDNLKDPLGMHGIRLEVDSHIIVASSPALKTINQVLEKARLSASHKTATGLAAAELVLGRPQKDAGVAVLDIGYSTTNVVVIEDGEVEHIAVLPMGSNHITNDLAIGLKTDLDIAELVKVKHASLDGSSLGETSFVQKGQKFSFDREMVRMIVEARVDEILEFIDKEFKKIHRSRKLPGGVVFVGGGAKLPGLAEFAKEKLELPARVGQWQHIGKLIGGMDEQRFAPAVGLMLLDMLLGPPAHTKHQTFSELQPQFLRSVKVSITQALRRFKRG